MSNNTYTQKQMHSIPDATNHRTGNIKKLSSSVSPLIQPKLRIGAPNDHYEQEADRIAEQVMRMAEPRLSAAAAPPPAGNNNPGGGIVQRTCASCSNEYQSAEDEDRPVISANLCPNCRVQRQSADEDEEEEVTVQTKANSHPVMTADIAGGIRSLHGGGRALSHPERHFFEPRIGHDFSRVRIHTDNRAAGLARDIHARAFTLGNDVVFGAGQYQPNTDSGKRLLAHELTHVLQQGALHRLGGGAVAQTIQRAPAEPPCGCKSTDFEPPPPYPPNTPMAVKGDICTAKECAPVLTPPRGNDCLGEGDRIMVYKRYVARLADGKWDAWLNVEILDGTLKDKYEDDMVEIRERFVKGCMPPKEEDEDKDGDKDKDKDGDKDKGNKKAPPCFGQGDASSIKRACELAIKEAISNANCPPERLVMGKCNCWKGGEHGWVCTVTCKCKPPPIPIA